MNVKAAKKLILEQLAHGKPIQSILDPAAPQVALNDPETGEIVFVADADWVKPDLPDWTEVVAWMNDDEPFRTAYERSFKYGAMYLADELLMLKERVLKDPKAAPAFKLAMDAIRTSAMWRDPKYSERTIQEIKNTAPQAPEEVKQKIRQLREELGFTVDVEAVEVVVKKPTSPARLAHLARAREAKAMKERDSRTDASET